MTDHELSPAPGSAIRTPRGSGPVVVAPDKFKGSLTAAEVAERVAAGLRRFHPDLDVRFAPIADGGDGTLAAVTARGFTPVPAMVSGPDGTPVEAVWGRRD